MLAHEEIAERLHGRVSEELEYARDEWLYDSDSKSDSEDEDHSDMDDDDFAVDFELEIQEELDMPKNRRHRRRKDPLPDAVVDGLDRREMEGIEYYPTTPFGEGRTFASSALFLPAWDQHEKDTLTAYQSRNADTAFAANQARWRSREALVKAAARLPNQNTTTAEPVGIANSVSSQNVGAVRSPFDADADRGSACAGSNAKPKMPQKCRHGVYRKSRGTGQRVTQDTIYVECDARITVSAVRDAATGVWSLVTRDEIHTHNHKCTQAVLDSHGKSALLNNPAALAEVKRLMQARAQARNICDTLAANYNITITPKQLSNLRRDRLGGQTAIANLKLLLERFSSFGKSRCLVIDDQQGNVCGIALQSAAQRALFDSYGDNLILDWTHNTNNMGFYLGSLMATSATERGVSVYDFLCLEQTEAMMTSVFEHFKKTNPGATDKIKSFIIDKDYKEWRVLEKCFVNSTVLLCQFHALKWFVFVVTKKKYSLSLELRDSVLNILYSMVYAKTTVAFDVLKNDLQDLLMNESPKFLKYMTDRWYNCRRMWSDCERSSVFTALNTTTNRIESSWNQVKRVLGKKLRIDLCLEAVFSYHTAVLRREYKVMNKYANRLILCSECDPFLRSAMADVCEYASEAVGKQWWTYTRQRGGVGAPYHATRCSGPAGELSSFNVTRPCPESAHTVNTAAWTCSCDFNVTSALPCRHVIFVAASVLRLPELPTSVIPARWSMKKAAKLRGVIRKNTVQIQSLRTGLLLSDPAFSQVIEPDFFELASSSSNATRRVAYFRLHRNETADVVVLNNLEKRGIVESSFAPIMQFLMSQSTPQFMQLAADLRDLLTEQISEWRKELSGTATGGAAKSKSKGKRRVKTKPKKNDNDAAIAESAALTTEVALDQDTPRVLDEINAAIAAAMADEDSFYQDADEVQRVRGIKMVTTPEEPPSTVIVAPRSSTPTFSDVDFISNNSDVDIDAFDVSDDFHAIPFPGSGVECLVVGTAPTPSFSAVKYALDSPATPTRSTTNEEGLEKSTVSENSISTSVLSTSENSVSTSEFSATGNSISTSVLSAIMTSVVTHHLQQSGDLALTKSTKRRASGVMNSMNVLKEITNNSAKAENEVDKTRGTSRISLSTLPPPLAAGWMKRQRTSGPATGDRLTIVDDTSDFPMQLRECTRLLLRVIGINNILPLWNKVPCRLNDQVLKNKEPTASIQQYPQPSKNLKYRVDSCFLQKLEMALKVARRGRSKFVDLTTSNSEVYVVCIDKRIRGFTEENILDLKEFYKVQAKCESYRRDYLWLRSCENEEEPCIPYMAETILEDEGEHGTSSVLQVVSNSARRSIRSILDACSFRTSFVLRSNRDELQTSIRLDQIIGYLPRNEELNDSCLMYALQQMASDYSDVYVVSCLKAARLPAAVALLTLRWVMFPIHVGTCHWCMIFCRPRASGIHEVTFYEPLQGSFDDEVSEAWTKECKPFLQNWLCRDGIAANVVEDGVFLQIQRQHDGKSCGVYCIAAAWDRMSEEYYFQKTGRVGESAACQLRLRVLWHMM